MSIFSRQDPEGWSRDRRLGQRFPIDLEVEYKLIRQGRIMQTGAGRTVNVSSSGVLFDAGRPLPPGQTIEISIAWPARLHNVSPLQLHVRGRTVRAQGTAVAIRIVAYDFRTKALTGGASGA